MESVTVKWFRFDESNPKKCMGFAFLQDGKEIFFHWGSRHNFTTYGDEPTFDDFSFPDKKPVTGDRLLCETGSGPKGSKIFAWGFESDYQKAVAEIIERKKREQEELLLLEQIRLETNPKFRVVEKEHRFGKPTTKQAFIRFVGTRQEFLDAINVGAWSYRQPLVYESGKVVDGYQYVRWFERETAAGWQKCEDPRKIELPKRPQLTVDRAAAILNNSVVKKSSGFAFISRPEMRTDFTWRKDDKVVAQGWDNGIERRVVLLETVSYLETEFWGSDAGLLQRLGKKAEPSIPDSRSYDKINSR